MYKCALLVRTDLKMSCGKIAAQCGHGIAQTMKGSNKKIVRDWMKSGEKIVILKVPNLEKMNAIKTQANKIQVYSKIIYDAGHTEVEPNTATVCVVGPHEESIITPLTKKLSLF